MRKHKIKLGFSYPAEIASVKYFYLDKYQIIKNWHKIVIKKQCILKTMPLTGVIEKFLGKSAGEKSDETRQHDRGCGRLWFCRRSQRAKGSWYMADFIETSDLWHRRCKRETHRARLNPRRGKRDCISRSGLCSRFCCQYSLAASCRVISFFRLG